MKKKLIETIMPVSDICKEAEKEKTGKSGMPSNIHIWWTRTPAAISRSILFASLIDDPSCHEDHFRTIKHQQRERERLLDMIKDIASIEQLANRSVSTKTETEIMKYNSGVLPRIYDPFVGSGSIPVEAHRLGLRSISSDINPVSTMMTTVLSDIPARFIDSKSIHPKKSNFISEYRGIAEDAMFYGEQIIEKTYKKIGKLFPKIYNPVSKNQVEVAAWLWTRTVKCPNPRCACQIPMSFCYDLAKKKGCETWVEPIVCNETVKFKIHHGNKGKSEQKSKVAHTAVFKCPSCGEITTDKYVKECGMRHEIAYQLLAVAAEENNRRIFLEATEEQEVIASVAKPKRAPHGELPSFPGKFSPPSFGYYDYADLFTNRQLVFLTTILDLIIKNQKDIEKDAIKNGYVDDKVSFANGGKGALAYSEAIRIILVLTVSKMLDRYSNLCSWNSSNGGVIRNVFSRAAMPMIWDFAEGNPFSSAGGSFLNTLIRVCDTIINLPFGIEGNTYLADASMPNTVNNAIVVTDLPYYDRVPYQELSDFCYIWLKYGLHDIYPSVFCSDITSKDKDLSAFSYRYSGNADTANAIYNENLKLSIKNIYESASESYPSVIGYLYKKADSQNELLNSWETFITALYEAGFSITASWPLYARKDDESTSFIHKGTPVMVVVRKEKDKIQAITRRVFVSNIKREIPRLLEQLSNNVAPIDLRPSVIGQALNLFTRHKSVMDADGANMKAFVASRIIEQELDTQMLNYIHNPNN